MPRERLTDEQRRLLVIVFDYCEAIRDLYECATSQYRGQALQEDEKQALAERDLEALKEMKDELKEWCDDASDEGVSDERLITLITSRCPTPFANEFLKQAA